MKKYLILAAALLLSAVSLDAGTVRMSKETLMDKIKGGWAGQTIGCTYGGPTEFKYTGMMIPDSVDIVWNEHGIKHYYETFPGLYDDVYMDLTFVDVFDKNGLDAPIEDFALAFANAGYQLWHGNLQARVNILAGIMPPESGHWKNNPHADDIDFQIEADYAGLMAPGMPNAAAFYSDAIGHMMNYGDGWYGGVYVAAMYALAFVRDNISDVVSDALAILPAQSRYARCIADVIRWHAQYPDDWKKTWQLCQDNYTDETDCPGEVGSTFRIDAVINGAYIVMGLLYGDGDFDRTIEVSCRCGQDSDCNPANAAGILATLQGYSAIPEKYLGSLHEVEDLNIAYTEMSMNKAYELSYGQALQVIEREGGKVKKDFVKIKVQKPEAVRYERSFDGLRQVEPVVVNDHAIDHDVTFSFEGNAIVLSGRLRNMKGGDYVAEVDLTLDGKDAGTILVPERAQDSQDHLYHNYDLSDGTHTMTLHVRNPRKDKQLWVNKAILYVKE